MHELESQTKYIGIIKNNYFTINHPTISLGHFKISLILPNLSINIVAGNGKGKGEALSVYQLFC